MKIRKILSVILVLSLVMLTFYGCKSDSTESTTTAINDSAINESADTETTEAQGAEEDIVQTNADGSKSIIYANPTVISEDTYYLSGKKIELPMTYSEFSSATGYKFTEQSMAQSPIKPGEYYNALSLTSKEIPRSALIAPYETDRFSTLSIYSLRSKISFNYLRIRFDFFRCSACNYFTIIKNHDFFTNSHYKFHIMLNQENS